MWCAAMTADCRGGNAAFPQARCADGAWAPLRLWGLGLPRVMLGVGSSLSGCLTLSPQLPSGASASPFSPHESRWRMAALNSGPCLRAHQDFHAPPVPSPAAEGTWGQAHGLLSPSVTSHTGDLDFEQLPLGEDAQRH